MSFFTIIVTFISMLVLRPLLTLLAIVVIGMLVFFTKKIGGNSGKYFVRQQVSLADVTGFVEEHMNGQRVVKAVSYTHLDVYKRQVMRDPKYCKPFLETILNIKISRIEYPEDQKTINLYLDAKSIRLDVYVEDDFDTVYNIEMQNGHHKNLPKRTRYYQGMIDLNLLDKGMDYTQLKQLSLIHI